MKGKPKSSKKRIVSLLLSLVLMLSNIALAQNVFAEGFPGDSNPLPLLNNQEPVYLNGFSTDLLDAVYNGNSANIDGWTKISANGGRVNIKIDGTTVGYFVFNKQGNAPSPYEGFLKIEIYDNISDIEGAEVLIRWHCSKYYAYADLSDPGVYYIPQLMQDNDKTQSFDQIWIGTDSEVSDPDPTDPTEVTFEVAKVVYLAEDIDIADVLDPEAFEFALMDGSKAIGAAAILVEDLARDQDLDIDGYLAYTFSAEFLKTAKDATDPAFYDKDFDLENSESFEIIEVIPESIPDGWIYNPEEAKFYVTVSEEGVAYTDKDGKEIEGIPTFANYCDGVTNEDDLDVTIDKGFTFFFEEGQEEGRDALYDELLAKIALEAVEFEFNIYKLDAVLDDELVVGDNASCTVELNEENFDEYFDEGFEFTLTIPSSYLPTAIGEYADFVIKESLVSGEAKGWILMADIYFSVDRFGNVIVDEEVFEDAFAGDNQYGRVAIPQLYIDKTAVNNSDESVYTGEKTFTFVVYEGEEYDENAETNMTFEINYTGEPSEEPFGPFDLSNWPLDMTNKWDEPLALYVKELPVEDAEGEIDAKWLIDPENAFLITVSNEDASIAYGEDVEAAALAVENRFDDDYRSVLGISKLVEGVKSVVRTLVEGGVRLGYSVTIYNVQEGEDGKAPISNITIDDTLFADASNTRIALFREGYENFAFTLTNELLNGEALRTDGRLDINKAYAAAKAAALAADLEADVPEYDEFILDIGDNDAIRITYNVTFITEGTMPNTAYANGDGVEQVSDDAEAIITSDEEEEERRRRRIPDDREENPVIPTPEVVETVRLMDEAIPEGAVTELTEDTPLGTPELALEPLPQTLVDELPKGNPKTGQEKGISHYLMLLTLAGSIALQLLMMGYALKGGRKSVKR